MDAKIEVLRHTVASLAYRAARAVEDAPASFAGFEGGGRRPDQILAHMGDLFDWAVSMAVGKPAWKNSTPLPWAEECARFFATLAAFDAVLAGEEPLKAPVDRLFQGPVADALTHVGQLAMLRRMAGCATRGENFYVAAIEVGKVGPAQAAAVKPF